MDRLRRNMEDTPIRTRVFESFKISVRWFSFTDVHDEMKSDRSSHPLQLVSRNLKTEATRYRVRYQLDIWMIA